MIRMIQRKLIIPRGDTGSFSIPALTTVEDGDVAVFSIIDELTHTIIGAQKQVAVTGNTLTIEFTHNDTVNLPVGTYVWDIKYYRNPVFADGYLVNGEEINSYYAAYSLPKCEIRETADKLLVSDNSPTATLTAEQLDIISAALASLSQAVIDTQANVAHYPIIQNETWYVWDATANDYVSTNVPANGIVGPTGNGISSIVKTNTSGIVDTYTINFTDGTAATFTVTNGESGVYVGTQEPTNPNVNVWINPDGEGIEFTGGGLPSGGTTGQILKKHSNTNYDAEWVNDTNSSGGDILTAEFFGAVGDKQTDDTAALSTAFNRSDAYIEGNNLFYKMTEIVMTQCKNLVISNFRFYHGISITLKNCENIIFKNCVWDEFQDNGIENKTVHCVILTTMHTGSSEWVEANNWRIDEVCKQITFDNCQFIGTHYTESTPSLYVGNKPHYNTGMCLRLDGVDGLRVTGCYFTQNRGNACIQQNSYAPLGDFEITNNFFYLNGWAGVELYRYTAACSYPRRIIQGNRFIGHGLGYIPWEYLEIIDEKNRGVGTAALLGGANVHIQNGYAHCAVVDNIFEDNNESSVEGWQWNPVKNNLIYGNGVLQTAESVVEMAAKYDIKYPLYIRKNPSQNPIYMGQYTDQRVYPEGETRTIENNTIGRMYGTRNPIVFRGYFYEPVIIRNNTMTDAALFTDKN